MASHRSLLPPCLAALLLLQAAVMSATVEHRREAHLEPADEAGYRTYIVLLEPPAGGQDMDAHIQSFLPSTTTALGEPRLRRSYRTLIHGFSARLTEEEVEWVSAKPGIRPRLPQRYPVPADHEDAGVARPSLPHGGVARGLARLWRP